MIYDENLFSLIVPFGIVSIIGGTALYILVDSKIHPDKYRSKISKEDKKR